MRLKVVFPYTRYPGEVVCDLRMAGVPCDTVDVSGSDRAYFDLLSELWTEGRAFAICEHDIVPHANAFSEFDQCPHDWCAFPFDYMCGVTPGLGCAKFSADLLARNPNAMARVGVMSDGVHPKRHWCRLDAWLTTVLEQAGERRHVHPTVVRHLDTGCSHGCC